ncbi:hypothetical protein VTL71DRAFT_3736 [Oculimacula yallundae]|uniref:NB-ARC domain-containing protein n=1 Tax=Oculimacula yallundae TaxID=86028 RepID=A0ABR4C3V8_9HELO
MPSFKEPQTIRSRKEIVKEEEKALFRLKKTDEYYVDFSNTTKFAVERWSDIRSAILAVLSRDDQEVAFSCPDGETLIGNIEAKRADPASTSTVKRQVAKVAQLPKVLETLASRFIDIVAPQSVDFRIVWGIIYVNLELSYASVDCIKRTTDLLSKLRRTVELFNRSLEGCNHPGEQNEPRIALVDFLDGLATVLIDLNRHLTECVTDLTSDTSWLSFNESMSLQFSELDQAVKHVHEISSYSEVNQQNQIKNLTLRHDLKPENEELANFPNFILDDKNKEFYGRRDEIDLIKTHLNPDDGTHRLRTYMIYGRRGVGKTAIALQFAHENLRPRGLYDAIFWIQCETSVSIRQSFTEVAVSLNLPGADRDKHHENLNAVQRWLKRTKKNWLLIFDNAENEATLQGYTPVGANGSILMTSRKYYNYTKDVSRHGETVKPFDPEASWKLLIGFLGNEWKQKVESPTEMEAAKAMLADLEGLALAIQQTAVLVKDPDIGGVSIKETYEKFKERRKNLPERFSSQRSSSEKALDALWDVIFEALQPNSRVLIGVLAWLSPDKIPIDLFLPRDQSALNGPLEFCKQNAANIDENNIASLYSLITPSPDFNAAIEDLLKRRLITRDGRYLKIHRVVQEATNFFSFEALQQSFDTATRLVYQQFPIRETNQSLYRQWNMCREYISHGVQLRIGYDKYGRLKTLKAPHEFLELMCNCGWYLYESGEYTTTALVSKTGLRAANDKESMVYAELLLIDGCHHYDMNELVDCRKSWERSLRVREKILVATDEKLAAIYNNLGNLELAMGNMEEAEEHYNQSMKLWLLGGDKTAEQLAITYLCQARFHMLKRDFKEAMRYTSLSESLIVRTSGADQQSMASVHYSYGNIYLLERNLDAAQRCYDACLKVALPNMPLHPLTAAAWFSLGVTQREKQNYELSYYLFEKAKTISQLRSPIFTDGSTARILWHMAKVIDSDKTRTVGTPEEAKDLRRQAEMAKVQILAKGQGREVLPSEDENPERREEVSYDVLLPLFFR